MHTPMFPLSSVLLPGAPLLLQVFEARYLEMIPEVLAGDREMGVVMIERGSEVGGGDVRCDVGAMARVIDVRPFAPNRLQLLAAGTRRIRVRRWMPDNPYPRAEVEDWPDEPEGSSENTDQRVTELLSDLPGLVSAAKRLACLLAGHPEAEISTAPADLGDDPSAACYKAAALAPLGPLDRFDVLSAPGVGERVAVTHQVITQAAELLRARIEMRRR